MKKPLCVIPVLLLFAMIPDARADSYLPTFTECPSLCSNPIPTAPAVTFPSPTTIDITLDGEHFGAFPLPSPDAPTDTYQWHYSGFFGESSSDTITISDLTDGQTVSESFSSSQGGIVAGDNLGPLVFSPISAATPEPTPVILMLLGASLIVFLTRKRFVVRTPRTA